MMGNTICLRSILSLMFLTFIVSQAQNDASALLEWKASLDKQSQSVLISWDRNNPCEKWTGIVCRDNPPLAWVVTNISLPSLSLKGRLDSLNFSSFHSLGILRLRNNSLFGSIPSNLANISRLRILHLGNNRFSGVIPSEIGMLPLLERLSLYANRLTGTIPNSLGNLTNLVLLSLAGNDLTGPIPREIGKSSLLESLDLARNQLSGPIPSTIFNSTSLRYLKLDDNMLHGTLPILPINIIAYSVKNNSIFGELPSGICSLQYLEVLHLSNNNFFGALPDCFKNNRRLGSLNLNGNRLQGLVPRSLANCRLLEVLDFGNNVINDTFPRWLDSLPQLQVLVLNSNKLHGTVKSSNSTLLFPKLRIIDLSRNFFTGHLPSKYIENFKAMTDIDEGEHVYIGGIYDGSYFTYKDSVVLTVKGSDLEYTRILSVLTTIDLSDNKFEGGIPSIIKMLNSLRHLNLSHNHLSGRIPTMLDNLTKLESLDLSSNQVTGKIPTDLTRLSFLAVFNVSGNQLSGIIPKGGQFNTFGNDSYQGNPGLCGFPLPKKCGDDEEPSQFRQQEEDDTSGFFDGFTWESVVLGYVCGIVPSVGLGCFMFSTGKPIWVMKILNTQNMRRKRPKIFHFAERRNRN